MKKGKKEMPTIFPWGLQVSGCCHILEPEPSKILRLDLRGPRELKRMPRQVGTPEQAVTLPLRLGRQPANPDGPTNSKPMPGAPHTWGRPGRKSF